MEFWSEIIHTALMGTDKRQIAAGSLPAGLNEAAELLAARPERDREDQFLSLAAVVFNYRQCGKTVLPQHNILSTEAAPEQRSYCSRRALRTLNDILAEENVYLLAYWLRECAYSGQLVTPEWVPVLMNKGVNQPLLQYHIQVVCGRRGEWLSRLNSSWQFAVHTDDEELWQTGTPEQRRKCLQECRQGDSAKGLHMLMQSWPQENANSKADLLKQLNPAVGGDQEWLESLLTEKSQKVREEVVRLLRQIPGSVIIESYWQLVRQAVTLKKGKTLLGIGSKTWLDIQPPAAVEEAIFKTGIEKLSSDKALKDEEFILLQLMGYVPPYYWQEHLAATPEVIIQYFQQEAFSKKYIPALVRATVHFRDFNWAQAFAQHSEVFYIDVIPLLPAGQQEYQSLRFFDREPDSLIQYARKREEPWSLELAKAIFRHTAKQPYQYTAVFYNDNILRMPPGVTAVLADCAPKEAQLEVMWSKMRALITRLVALKEQTTQAFNE